KPSSADGSWGQRPCKSRSLLGSFIHQGVSTRLIPFSFLGAITQQGDLSASQMAMRDRPFCFTFSPMPIFRFGSGGKMFEYDTISKARVKMIKGDKVEQNEKN
ncbi:hypothetical protein, partial [Geobacillus thermocatenulatus]|uniref:hypothetical protein n=1 Tax=Geobacillus thermocatenulatus TaxID=33938 RepID=UPI00051944DB